MIEICNLRKEKPKNAYDFKVDRTSILGNPFFMKDETCRNDVCDKYKEYFYIQIEKSRRFSEAIEALIAVYIQTGKLRLFCWCSPSKCHAETIRDYILEIT
jgi:hypothetical protein